MQNNICFDIFWYGDMILFMFERNFLHSIYKIYVQKWGGDIINAFIWIFVSTVQEMFHWKLRRNFIISYLPYFHPILIKILMFCSKVLTPSTTRLRWNSSYMYGLCYVMYVDIGLCRHWRRWIWFSFRLMRIQLDDLDDELILKKLWNWNQFLHSNSWYAFFNTMGYITRPCLRVNWMRKIRTIMESILSVELFYGI